jgi:hypothetical protein
MKTTDFASTITSLQLIENIEKQFGVNVVLDKYNREQLEDFRNKLRTKIFQQEGSAKINDLLTNETYQKNKAMLELLNTRIKEMLGEQMKLLRDKIDTLSEGKKSKPDFLDLDKDGNKKEPMKKAAKDAKVKEAAKPDFLDLDKDGNKKEPMKKAAKDAKKVAEAKCTECGMYESKCKCDKVDEDYKLPSGVTVVQPETHKMPKAPKSSKPKNPLDKSKMQSIGQKVKSFFTKEGKKGGKCCCKTEGKKHCPVHSTMESAPSAGLSKEKKSAVVKKAKAGKDIGKKGKGFEKIVKAAGGGEKGKRIAAAAMWKNIPRESLENYRHNVKFINESLIYLLAEDEEGKAKAITAAGDIVKDFTSWMQRVGQYQTKAMIELADAIRADFGVQEAETFKQAVAPALATTLETLTAQREAISNAVATLAGESVPEVPMGMEPGLDASAPDALNPEEPVGDEFAASDAGAGSGTSGREMREDSESLRVRKLAEAHNIIAKLAK